ncbi:MAG: hypothetical protein B7X93_03050 [Hydrogenophilales bacterium 17-61-9]|nr:MAG: hypothetical protein B7X93_03050 [Hydrogenophilales bacterium 17-61-9]
MMETLTKWRTMVAACCKYNTYRRTGSRRALRDAEKLAHLVGETDTGASCPALFKGNPTLEREWASGKGAEFFYNWMVRHGRFEASA